MDLRSLVCQEKGVFVMIERVRMHNMRRMVRNEQESTPAHGAQELPRIFVADACIGFSKAWNPHPSFFTGGPQRPGSSSEPAPTVLNHHAPCLAEVAHAHFGPVHRGPFAPYTFAATAP